MSVLKCHRAESKAEYINTAHAIKIETLWFLSRISARFQRLMADHTAMLASQVVSYAEKANSIFPSSDARVALREYYLLKARASLMALDVDMADVYELLMSNPQGCFTKANGKTVSANAAMDKIDRMAQSLGEKIDAENGMLTALIKGNKKR